MLMEGMPTDSSEQKVKKGGGFYSLVKLRLRANLSGLSLLSNFIVDFIH